MTQFISLSKDAPLVWEAGQLANAVGQNTINVPSRAAVRPLSLADLNSYTATYSRFQHETRKPDLDRIYAMEMQAHLAERPLGSFSKG